MTSKCCFIRRRLSAGQTKAVGNTGLAILAFVVEFVAILALSVASGFAYHLLAYASPCDIDVNLLEVPHHDHAGPRRQGDPGNAR